MKIVKPGQHRLFENDSETAATLTTMLLNLEKNGMEAVRKYSSQFDAWNTQDLELGPDQIDAAIHSLLSRS